MLNQNYSKGVLFNLLTENIKEWEKTLRFIKSLPNVRHLEILIEYLPEKDKELKMLASLTKNYKIILHAPFLYFSLTSHISEINKLTKKFYLRILEIADFLKAEVVTFHGGSYPFFLSEEWALNSLAKNLRSIKNFYKGKSIFTIENPPSSQTQVRISCPSSLKKMIELKKLIPDIKFTLDVGHAIRNNEDFMQFLKTYKDSIMDIHLHDAIPGREDHLALRKGKLNLLSLLKLLDHLGYNKYLTLETVRSQRDIKISWQILNKAKIYGK